MVVLNPLKYPVLCALFKDSVHVDTGVAVDKGILTFSFELSIKLPDSIASLFD